MGEATKRRNKYRKMKSTLAVWLREILLATQDVPTRRDVLGFMNQLPIRHWVVRNHSPIVACPGTLATTRTILTLWLPNPC